MHNKNKVVAISIASTLLFTSMAQAEVHPAKLQSDKPSAVLSMPSKFPLPPKEEGPAALMAFLKSKDSLTAEERESIKKMFDYAKEQFDSINKDNEPIKIGSEEAKRIAMVNKALFNSLKAYVDPAKMPAYEAFVNSRSAQLEGEKSGTKLPPQPKKDGEKIGQKDPHMQSPTEMLAPIMQFFRSGKDISEEQKKAFMELAKAYLDTIKAIVDDEDLSPEAKGEKIKAANINLASALSPYIEPSRSEAFNTFISEKGDKPLIKEWIGQKTPENKKNIPKKAKVLSQKIIDQFNKKLDSLPQDKKEAVFNAVIKRIETLLANVKSEKVKAQLGELKEIVQLKLDELDSETGEGELLDQVLDGAIAE